MPDPERTVYIITRTRKATQISAVDDNIIKGNSEVNNPTTWQQPFNFAFLHLVKKVGPINLEISNSTRLVIWRKQITIL